MYPGFVKQAETEGEENPLPELGNFKGIDERGKHGYMAFRRLDDFASAAGGFDFFLSRS